MKLWLLLAIGLLPGACGWLRAQQPATPDSLPSAEFRVSGYLKSMQTLLFFNQSWPNASGEDYTDTFLLDQLIHHRLNAELSFARHFRLHAGLRTRVFYGDLVRATPDYAQAVNDPSNDWIPMSLVLVDRPDAVVHSVLDRLYAEYAAGRWEVRLGRQRIHWGISSVWNPNDLFNAFAFTDFDYEERPGTDALRIRYHTGFASSVEVAVRGFSDPAQAIAAARWQFNYRTYDVQILGGYWQEEAVLGAGWAGNLGQAGFKGEASWFQPLNQDQPAALAATSSLEYVWSGGHYTQAGYLYNSTGSPGGRSEELFSFELSARNLYPFRHAVFAQWSAPVNPLLQAGTALIYSPGPSQALFFNPLVSWSLAPNWDIDLVGQLVFQRGDAQYTSPLQAAFFRLKYSY
jgi:hypothetical protein